MSDAGNIAWLDRPEREETEPRSITLQALDLKGGEVVADVGAGSGYYTFALAEAVGPKGTVLAVEIQEEMLAALRRRAARVGATNVGLIRGTATDARLPPGRMDLVLMVDVYHELEFPYEVMQNVVRSLKPGGRVALVEYRAEDPDVPIRPLHKMTEAQIVKELQAVGLERVATVNELPWQHLVIFKAAAAAAADLLDLSALVSEYGRMILPCKACVSSAMPLCHWPCSCYPNHALGQVNDWMNEIYPRWVAALGVMIVTPVYWHQAPSGLKLSMDRLVCADGGNPDPTSTAGKAPERAKELELQGWHYPRHLAGRAFAIAVHGDAAGVQTVRRSLSDWLTDMHLVPAGRSSTVDRYVGYFEPYATSHEALDRDDAFHEEVRNAARALANAAAAIRQGRREPDEALEDPRPK